MYEQHFGLSEAPFSLTPDTGFFYNYPSHQEALNVLQVALYTGEGFIKVTGEVGTGKTLLCRKLLNTLGDDFVTAYIPNPILTPAALRQALADELGIRTARRTGQNRIVKLINERLMELKRKGKRVVVLLDEAQALPQDCLEAVRLLTNLETEKSKLLQVVLFGQPELDARLKDPSIRQLKQRISFSYKLQALNKNGVEGYVNHRLLTAGYNGPPLFTRRALGAVVRAGRGIPRLTSILCHKALLAAYGQGTDYVAIKHVRSAIRDTEDIGSGRRTTIHGLWYLGISASLTAGAGLYVLMGWIP